MFQKKGKNNRLDLNGFCFHFAELFRYHSPQTEDEEEQDQKAFGLKEPRQPSSKEQRKRAERITVVDNAVVAKAAQLQEHQAKTCAKGFLQSDNTAERGGLD
eukprot:g8875.t1